METILWKASARAPEIKFDPDNGKIEIKGRSIPENAAEFYAPLLKSLEQYVTHPVATTLIDIQLVYFNTDSARCLLKMFRCLETIPDCKNRVTINWFYEEEDVDMKDSVEDFRSIINLTLNLQPQKSL